jgi:hypothetical protein
MLRPGDVACVRHGYRAHTHLRRLAREAAGPETEAVSLEGKEHARLGAWRSWWLPRAEMRAWVVPGDAAAKAVADTAALDALEAADTADDAEVEVEVGAEGSAWSAAEGVEGDAAVSVVGVCDWVSQRAGLGKVMGAGSVGSE